ncbi:hypothetical protein R5R35_001494 [Gryllus longicercus]|uniref:Chitin-binding type-2 domain-containing protein n=1 Tax=Gryllus longicercus TaxID=2509291 RepID=A0AAN9WWH8_9ORTH
MKPARGAPATHRSPPPPLALLLLLLGLVAASLVHASAAQEQAAEKTKRQIFREQVLPQRGGKIPEEAFRVDRLALNRLNKDGIAVPDGVLLDARRRAQHHPRHNSDLERSVVKVLVTPDGRYAAPEGRLRPQRPLTVDSTYIIRPPIGSHHRPPPVVGRPLPGPPLHIPTLKLLGPSQPPQQQQLHQQQPYQQPHRQPHQQPHQQPNQQPHHQLQLYAAQHQGPATLPSLSALPPATSFQDSFNGLFPTAGLDDFDLLVAQLNARAEREAARIAAAHSPASGPGPGPASAPAPAPAPWPTTVECGPPPPPHAPPRLLADPTRCQVFHVCQRDGRRDTFLCPAGTLFSSALARCDWWYNVRC